MAPYVVIAPAKVNLFLEVLGRRDDGFHALETVFQTLALHDTVTVDHAPGDGITLHCDDPSLPVDAGNLAWRAAAAWQRLAGLPGRLAITLTKRIPVGAGLGGGSSDAAAVLRGLQRLAPKPLTDAVLAGLASELGSDVPFFLLGGCAHATGRGEVLTALADLPPLPVTVVQPAVGCPTPAVFAALSDVERGPRPARGAAWWSDRRDPAAWLHNRLTAAALRVQPAIAEALAWLAAQHVPLVMTGSGSACLALGHLPDAPPPLRTWRTTLRPRTRLDAAD